MSANRMHAQGSFGSAFTTNNQSPTSPGGHYDSLNGQSHTFHSSSPNSNNSFIVSPQTPLQQHPNQAPLSTSSNSKNSNAATMPRENIRSIRNQAEKQRRDKLNGFINALAANVPFVTQAKKRQDKTSVLRLAAAYIRLKKLPIAGKQHLTSNGASLLTEFLDSVNGFVLISNCVGKILFVSPGVEKQLGHQDNEVIGFMLDNFLHEDDFENVTKIINNVLTNEILQGERRSSEINFVCRLREKNQSRTEVSYRQMRVTGHMTAEFAEDSSSLFECVKPGMSNGQQQGTSGKSQFKSSNSIVYPEQSEYYRNGSFLTQSNLQRFQPFANDIIFLCHVEEIHAAPDPQLKLSDIGYDEYVSRHSLDGTLLYADHRIASILGFLPKEVSGKSAYDFILPEDYSIALFAHKLMLGSTNGTGIVVHRLTGVDNSVIFLQTMGCLKFNENGLIDHFACVSRMLKESDGERELEYFVNRFTPHIADKSAIELYESMQMQCINPFSSKSFNDLASAPDAKSPTPWRQTEHKRLLPARFERYARDQHKTMIMQRHNPPCRSSDSSPQAQVFTKIEEPDNEQILQMSIANGKLNGVENEEVAMQNKLTLQKSIRNLNEKSEFLMVKSQHHAKSGGRKRALTASQDMELQKKAKHSNPNNTFIRSFISADKSTKKPNKNGQATCKSVDSDGDDCLPKSKSVSGVDNLPESRYKIAHGQGDYTYMLGARFYTYNHLENAKVLSIYTPPEALEAQQRSRLINDAQAIYNASGGSTPTPTWVSPTNQSPGAFFGPLENTFTNSPYLNFQNEQSGNITNKSPFVDAPSSSSATPTHSRTPDMTTPLCEELESGNIDCQLDAMQQANNAVGPSVNFHLHHHHLKRSNSSLNQYNSDSCSNFAFEYSEPPPILPVNETSFPDDDSSNGIKDYLSQIDPNTIFSGKMCETNSLTGHERGSSGPGSGAVQQNGSIFVPDTSRTGGDNSYPSSGQTNNSNNNTNNNSNTNNTNNSTSYSPNACYQYSLGPAVNPNGDFDSMNKPEIIRPMYQMLHDNSFRPHFNTHVQSDQSILTMGVHQQPNLYSSYDASTLNYDYVIGMEGLPTKVADAAFSLSQPENSYDFTEIMNSVLYSPETQFSTKMDSDSLLLAESDFVNDIVTGKRVNNSSPADNTSTSSEEFL